MPRDETRAPPPGVTSPLPAEEEWEETSESEALQEKTSTDIKLPGAGFEDLVETCLRELETDLSDDSQARIHLELARLFEHMEQHEDALKHYLAAREKNDSSLAAIRGARQLLLHDGRVEDAIPLVVAEINAVADTTSEGQWRAYLATLQADWLDDPEAAKKTIDDALNLDARDPTILRTHERIHGTDFADPSYGQCYRADVRYRAAARVRRALALERRGELDDAAECLEEAVRLDPTAAGAAPAMIRVYREQQNWPRLAAAIGRFARSLDDPDYRASLYAELALIQRLHLEQPDDALLALNNAVQAQPAPLLLELIADQYREREMFVSLLPVLEQLASSTDEAELSAEYLHELAGLLEVLGRYEDGLGAARRAHEAHPSHRDAERRKMRLQRITKNWRDLIQSLLAQIARQVTPGHAAALHEEVARIYERRLGLADDAVTHHRHALRLDPQYEPSLRALTRLLQGNTQDALELLESAAENAATTVRQHAHLWEAARLAERVAPRRAVKLYRRLEESECAGDAAALAALHGRQRALESAGAWSELCAALREEIDLEEHRQCCARLEYRLATVAWEHLADVETAQKGLRTALKLDPSFIPAQELLARLLAADADWKGLIELRQPAGDGPRAERVDSLLRVSRILTERVGDSAAAADVLTEALALAPDSKIARMRLARLQRTQGQAADLLGTLAAAREHASSSAAETQILTEMGRVAEHMLGDLDAAHEHYQAALAIDPKNRFARIGALRLELRNRQWKQAVHSLEQAASESTDETITCSHLLLMAEIAAAELGDSATAVRKFRAAGHRGATVASFLGQEYEFRREGRRSELVGLYAEHVSNLNNDDLRASVLREVARLLEHSAEDHRAPLIAAHNKVWEHRPRDQIAMLALENLARKERDRKMLAKVALGLADTAQQSSTVSHYYTKLGLALDGVRDPLAKEAYQQAYEADRQNRTAQRGLRRVAERSGDQRAACAALRKEAEMTVDPMRAGELLTASASIAVRSLADATAALSDLESALTLHAANSEAFDLLFHPLFENHALAAARLLSLAAKDPANTQQSAKLWSAAATRYEAGQRIDQALPAAQRAVDASPDSIPLMRNLVDLHREAGQPGQAVSDLTSQLEKTSSDEMRTALHEQLAVLLEEEVGDWKAAMPHLLACVEQDASQIDLWRRLALCRHRDGDTEGARTALEKGLAQDPTPAERAQLLTLWASWEVDAGRLAEAETPLAEAIGIVGVHSDAAELYRRVTKQTGSWAGYVEAARKHLSGLSNGDAASAAKEQLVIGYEHVARVYEREMQSTPEAITTLQEGLVQTGGAPKLRRALVPLLRRTSDFDQALLHLRALQKISPTDAVVWKEMALVYEDNEEPDAARLARAPLQVLGETIDGSTHRPAPAEAAQGSCDRERQRDLAVEGCLDESAAGLLGSIVDAVEQLYRRDLRSIGISKRNLINARQTHPLHRVVTRLNEIFSTRCSVYEHPKDAPFITIELTTPACVVVNRGLRDLPLAEQTFLLGFAISQIATRTHPASIVSPEELYVLLSAAARTALPEYMPPGPVNAEILDPLTERLRDTVPRKWRREVEHAAMQYANNPLADVARWRSALRQTALRSALLVCDDLNAAIGAFRRMELLTDLDGPTLIRSSPAAADLVSFWMSVPAEKMRHGLGSHD